MTVREFDVVEFSCLWLVVWEMGHGFGGLM